MNFDFNQQLILENDRSRLEPLSMDHFEALLTICESHPDLLRYSPSPFGQRADLERYMKTAIDGRPTGKRYAFAIFDKTKQQYAGSTSFGNIENYHRRLEIGWTWIAPDFQRTGLNRNNKKLMLQYVFDVLQFERVEFKIDARNVSSRKAVEAIGGQYEGMLRSHTLMTDGHRRDTVYYSILKD